MNRREAISGVAWILGGTIVGANLFLEGCTRPADKDVARLFDPEMEDFLGDIADTILPPTATPGAKEAGVGAFIPVMVRDCYTVEDQQVVMSGLGALNKKAESDYGSKFQDLTKEDRTMLLDRIDREAKAYHANKTGDDPNHYFYLIKQLTVLGYFSSEIGATQSLRYVQVPGRYDGDIPYQKGDKAWAV